MEGNAYDYFKSRGRMDEKTILEKMLKESFDGDTTAFLQAWEEIRNTTMEKIKRTTIEKAQAETISEEELDNLLNLRKFANRAISYVEDLQKSNQTIIFEQLENKIKQSYERQIEIIKEKRNLANKFASVFEKDNISHSAIADTLAEINRNFNDLDIENEKLKASIDEQVIQLNNIDANFNLSELKPSTIPFLNYDETADIYKRIMRSKQKIKGEETSYTNEILDSIELMANINLRSIQSETFNYDKMVEDIEKELSYETPDNTEQVVNSENPTSSENTTLVENENKPFSLDSAPEGIVNEPTEPTTEAANNENAVEQVTTVERMTTNAPEQTITTNDASAEAPIVTESNTVTNETPVQENTNNISLEAKPTSEAIPTYTVESTIDNNKLAEAINQYKSIVSIINSLVASVNMINREEYALLSDTRADLGNFIAKEQEASKLSEQIFDKKLELSKLEFNFYNENKYALALNEEIKEVKIDEIEANDEFTSFVEAHNRIVDINYELIEKNKNEIKNSAAEKKDQLITEIDKCLAIIDMEKSIISRRALLEKQKNKSFDIISFYENNKYLNRKKSTINNENTQENIQQINNVVEQPTPEPVVQTMNNTEETTTVENTQTNSEAPQQTETKQEDKKIIKIHKNSLNFNTTQKVNTLKSGITRGNLITIKILKDAIRIEYNKYLVERLNDLKLQVQTVASYNQDGQKNINIGGIEQLKDGKQVQMINNPQELENATISFVDGNNNVVADYDLYNNETIQQAIGNMSK